MRGAGPKGHMRGAGPKRHMRGAVPKRHMRGAGPKRHMRGAGPKRHMPGAGPTCHCRAKMSEYLKSRIALLLLIFLTSLDIDGYLILVLPNTLIYLKQWTCKNKTKVSLKVRTTHV